jgi:hypothetical protein
MDRVSADLLYALRVFLLVASRTLLLYDIITSLDKEIAYAWRKARLSSTGIAYDQLFYSGE